MSETLTLRSHAPEVTQRIGRVLGAHLRPGDVVALVGPLGAGKTMLVKGIAAGAEVTDPRRVTSPTFVIVNEYEGRLHLYHVDAYRLGGDRELQALGVDEFAENGALLIEWADRVPGALPDDPLTITIDPVGEQIRNLRLSGRGRRASRLIEAVAQSTSDLQGTEGD